MIESHINEGKQSVPAEGPVGYVYFAPFMVVIARVTLTDIIP